MSVIPFKKPKAKKPVDFTEQCVSGEDDVFEINYNDYSNEISDEEALHKKITDQNDANNNNIHKSNQ